MKGGRGAFSGRVCSRTVGIGLFDCGKAKARIGLDVLGTRSLDVRSLFGRIRIRDFETML